MKYSCGCEAAGDNAPLHCPVHGSALQQLKDGSSVLTDQATYGNSSSTKVISKTIRVRFSTSYDERPLASIEDSLCGNDSQHYPEQLRAIASLLLKIAADVEAYHTVNQKMKPKHRSPKHMTYTV